MSRRTAGPSTTLRSGRDDKVEGGGPPLAFVEVDGQNQRNSNQPNFRLPACSSTHSVRYDFQEAVFRYFDLVFRDYACSGAATTS